MAQTIIDRSNGGRIFGIERAAAWAITRLPESLSQLVMSSKWYDQNGSYKWPVGMILDCKESQYKNFGPERNERGYRVVGYASDLQSRCALYVIETSEGLRKLHFKWNLENQFESHDSQRKPFSSHRFESSSARLLCW